MAAHADAAASGLRAEAAGEVLVITLDRPQARNALTQAVSADLLDAYRRLDESPGLRVGVLTGANGCFCSGMDLKEFARGLMPDDTIVREPPAKPLIAAVEGFALAGGLELALACDLIVAARGARLGIPEAKRGLAAAGGGLIRLPRRLPYHVAMELALTGEPLLAERAAELGLVSRLAEPGRALDAALELAALIAANGPLAVTAAKRVVAAAADHAETELWALQDAVLDPVMTSGDALEGARAFAEKRPPQWRGE